MQSRRDLLYIKPWEEKRYQDHRAKVLGALPVVDAGAPLPRLHVARKLKAVQHEAERLQRVQRDNFALLQRLQRVMRAHSTRLDHRWLTPQPTFHHRVGVFYPTAALQRRLARGSTRDDSSEDHHVKCYACHRKKSAATLDSNKGLAGDQHCLPPLHL